MTGRLKKPLFPLGTLFATAAAIIAAKEADDNLIVYLQRHACGDWGSISNEEAIRNRQALDDGTRLQSLYQLKGGKTVCVITEGDRSSTMILLSEQS